MIKRGGIFVSPDNQAEAAMAGHSAIAACVAAGAPSERWGQEVEVFVVLKAGSLLAGADLHSYASGAPGQPSRPVRFWSFNRIPRTPFGKVARNEIAELRGSADAFEVKRSGAHQILRSVGWRFSRTPLNPFRAPAISNVKVATQALKMELQHLEARGSKRIRRRLRGDVQRARGSTSRTTGPAI